MPSDPDVTDEDYLEEDIPEAPPALPPPVRIVLFGNQPEEVQNFGIALTHYLGGVLIPDFGQLWLDHNRTDSRRRLIRELVVSQIALEGAREPRHPGPHICLGDPLLWALHGEIHWGEEADWITHLLPSPGADLYVCLQSNESSPNMELVERLGQFLAPTLPRIYFIDGGWRWELSRVLDLCRNLLVKDGVE